MTDPIKEIVLMDTAPDGCKIEKPAAKKPVDPNLRIVWPSSRRKGMARHKGESFADMAFRLGGGVVARGQQ